LGEALGNRDRPAAARVKSVMRPPLRALALIAPALLVLVALLLIPIGMLGVESLRTFVPGHVGGQSEGGFTFQNYRELVEPAYLFYFLDTLRIGLVVSVLALLGAFPLAYCAARAPQKLLRISILGMLVTLLFLSMIARLYAMLMAYGPNGPLNFVVRAFAVGKGKASYAEIEVIFGLLHYVLPVVALMLIGSIQNVDPKLLEAAESLGAPRWLTVLQILVPAALPGILSAFFVSFAMCISNFVVPLILGSGVVLFASNLMYIRFSEVANFPSGAAIGIVMLVLSFAVVFGLSAGVRRILLGRSSA
jgi:ABC-type spermidine/putrescine transport system permease subunit I